VVGVLWDRAGEVDGGVPGAETARSGGPAPQPLAAIELDYDPESDSIYATGTVGGEMFERYFKPWYAKIFQVIKKQKSDLFIFFHTCGSSRYIIPDLIESGVDILNPVQYNSRDMDPRKQNDFAPSTFSDNIIDNSWQPTDAFADENKKGAW